MTRAQISALLACFPIWMRPFVWVQLMLIRRAQMRHRRELLIDVCHVTGRLRVLHMGDAPLAPGLYHYEAPRLTAWARLAIAPPSGMGVFIRALSVLCPCTAPGPALALTLAPDTS